MVDQDGKLACCVVLGVTSMADRNCMHDDLLDNQVVYTAPFFTARPSILDVTRIVECDECHRSFARFRVCECGRVPYLRVDCLAVHRSDSI